MYLQSKKVKQLHSKDGVTKDWLGLQVKGLNPEEDGQGDMAWSGSCHPAGLGSWDHHIRRTSGQLTWSAATEVLCWPADQSGAPRCVQTVYNGTCHTPRRSNVAQSSATPIQVSLPSQIHAYALYQILQHELPSSGQKILRGKVVLPRETPLWTIILAQVKISTVLGLSDKVRFIYRKSCPYPRMCGEWGGEKMMVQMSSSG